MLGRIGINPNEARQKGFFVEAGHKYTRQLPLNDKLLLKGKKCSVNFALDTTVQGYYAIIPAKFLQPSHLGGIENPKHFLPEAQPRNRAMSQSGANTPIIMAEHLRPAEIVEGATAYTGTPIVNERGEVIQGNGRAFSLKYYWDNLKNDPSGYVAYLQENESYHGVKNFSRIKQPVLVRVLMVDDEEAIKLGQFKQADTEAVSSKTNESKAKVNKLTDSDIAQIIAKIFEGSDENATFSEMIDKSGIFSLLIKLKVLRADELELYIKNDRINAEGKDFVESLIVGTLFKGADINTPEIFAQLPSKIQSAIIKSIGFILSVPVEKSLKTELSESIVPTRDFLAAEKPLKSWLMQTEMFGESPKLKYSPLVLRFVEIFATSSTQKLIVSYFQKYANLVKDKAADLVNAAVTGLTKAEAIKKVFDVDFRAEKVSNQTVNSDAVYKLIYKGSHGTWEILDYLPKGWIVDKQNISPLNHCVSISNGLSRLNQNHKTALWKKHDGDFFEKESKDIVKVPLDTYINRSTPDEKDYPRKMKAIVKAPVDTKIEKPISIKDFPIKTEGNHLVKSVSSELKHLAKFIKLSKRSTKQELLTALNSLQTENKKGLFSIQTSPFADLLVKINESYLTTINGKAPYQIDADIATIEQCSLAVASETVYPTVNLVLKYIRLQGKESTVKAVDSLRVLAEKLVFGQKEPFASLIPTIKYNLSNWKAGQPLPILATSIEGLGALPPLMTAQEVSGISYPTLTLEGSNDFKELLGSNVAFNVKIMIWGQPGAGKSTASLMLAKTLAQNGYKTLYISDEEYGSVTLAEKLNRIGGKVDNLFFSEKIQEINNSGPYDVVFCDSVNSSKLSLTDFRNIRKKYPQTAFVLIFQATKGGQFKGAKDFEHDVDIVVEVAKGVASTTKNRYKELSSIEIF